MKILNSYTTTPVLNFQYKNVAKREAKNYTQSILTAGNAHNICAANNIAFHGLFSNNNPSAQDILCSAIDNLDNRSILIFSDDLANASQLLRNQLNNIDFPLDKVYFVKNPYDETGFAIYKDNNDKNKIFKLHLLNSVAVLEGGTDEYKLDVKRNFVQCADEPIELKDKQYIKFGLYKHEHIFEIKLKSSDSKRTFDKYVEKYSFFDNKENAQKFNSARISDLGKKDLKTDNSKKITFDDVGGQDDIIKSLEQSVIFPVKYPDFFKNFRVNKGILLYGPPRCGKTMLALALANELNVNFIKLSADDLTHANVGKTEENWRNVFKQARENQPTIIFVDEFDAIAKSRSGADQARHQDNVVNQLLSLMSDLEKSDDMVFVVAATNREDLLDKALINTGRFGLKLEVKEPDLEGTNQIYEKHSRNKPLDSNIDKDAICQKMYENHFNGSDIAETFYVAHNHSLETKGIYDKMRNGTVTRDDLKNFSLSQQDMEAAIEIIAKQKTNK